MMTVHDAYEAFIQKYPEAKTEYIFDWGDFYSCSRLEGEDAMIDGDEWRIDRVSGEITKMEIWDHMEELRKHPNDEDIIRYSIKELKQRAS